MSPKFIFIGSSYPMESAGCVDMGLWEYIEFSQLFKVKIVDFGASVLRLVDLEHLRPSTGHFFID